jgi:predicted esterase
MSKNKAIICPGGGYRLIGTNEGEPVARRFEERGYDATVLNYAVGERAVFTTRGFADFEPVRELRAALETARAEAGVGGKIILAGFSAGAHLAAGYCLSHTMETNVPMPDALLLSYIMPHLGDALKTNSSTRKAFDIPYSIRKYGLPKRAKNLPIHIWHSTTDKLVPFETFPAFVKLLEDAGANVHSTKFREGRHGDPATTTGWFEAAMDYFDTVFA